MKASRAVLGEDEALQQALHRFGDPKELADQLWKANLRRMKLRSIAKWAFRLVATPAALLFAVLLLWDGLDLPAYLAHLSTLDTSYINWWRSWDTKLYEPTVREDISEKDIAAHRALKQPHMEQADHCVELFPDKPMFRANKLIAHMFRMELENKENDINAIRKGIALADDAERLDPDNAFYNYYKTSLLWNSSEIVTDGPPETIFPRRSREGEITEGEIAQIEIHNAAMFEEGLAEVLKGAAKSRYDSYIYDIQEYVLSLEEPRTSLVGVSARVADENEIVLPYLATFRYMNRLVLSYAAGLIEKGDYVSAREILAIAPVPATQLGQIPDSLIGVLVAMSVRTHMLFGSAKLYEQMGLASMAETARREAEVDMSTQMSAHHRDKVDSKIEKYGGVLGHMTLAGVSMNDFSILKPIRNAERAMLERAVLAAVALFVLLEIALLTIQSAFGARYHNIQNVSLGWQRLTLILLFGIAIPVAIYYVITRLPFGSVHFSVMVMPLRVASELGLAVAAIVFLVNVLGYRAIRVRAAELDVPIPSRMWPRILLNCTLWFSFFAGLCVVLDTWSEANDVAFIVATVVISSAVTMMLYATLRAARRSYRTMEARSLLPVLIASLLLLGIAVRFPLKTAESRAVAVLETEGRRLFLDEIEYSKAKVYRTYLQSLPENGRLGFAEGLMNHEGQDTDRVGAHAD